jgi:hypothetical protein
MLTLPLSPSTISAQESGFMLLEVLISLAIFATCAAMIFAFLGRTAQVIASLEETHQSRFQTPNCAPDTTRVLCNMGKNTVTIVR